MFDFNKERVLIAGGSSGIGLATAQLLIKCGAAVIITGRHREKLDAAAKHIGPAVETVVFDAANVKQRALALTEIGGINHLVVCLSGGKGAGAFEQVSSADVLSGIEAKFLVHYALAQESLPHLSATGSITFVSAISARAANPGTAGLAAINAAIEGLVKPLAMELKPRRVNAVAPGVINTPWWNWLAEDQKQATFKRFAAATPVGRVGEPEDVAKAIVFLVGNSFMTGSIIDCDGGLRLTGQTL